jgi:hypothetical protein
MSVHAPTVTFMDPSPTVNMHALWPELPGQRRPFEVVVSVPREDGGEPLVPRLMPPEVLSCWSADQVIVSATVLASRPAAAVAAVEALVPELLALQEQPLRFGPPACLPGMPEHGTRSDGRRRSLPRAVRLPALAWDTSSGG